MVTSPNLLITHIEQNQAQKEVVANSAFDELDASITDTVDVDMSGGPATVLQDPTYVQNIRLRLTGHTATETVTLPATKRLILIQNDGTGIAAVTVGSTVIALPVGARALFYTDGTTDGLELMLSSAGEFIDLSDTPSAYTGEAGNAAIVNATEDGLEFGAAPGGGGVGATTFVAAREIFIAVDEKATNVDGGTSSTGWQKRTLNTERVNDIAGASLLTDQITLPAGTYLVRASAPAYKSDRHQIRLRNTTDGSTTLIGGSEYNLAIEVQTRSHLEGYFTITEQKTFELQHQITAAQADVGLGIADDEASESEEYARITIEKILDAPNITRFIAIEPTPRGALIELSSDQTIQNVTDTPIEWGATSYDSNFTEDPSAVNPFTQKFWLGPDLTFTADNTTDELTATAHGMATGDGPFQLTNSGGALPTGLATATNYWAILISANVIQLATSRGNAKAGTAIDFTTDGTGTHTLDRASVFVIPEGVTKIKVSAAINFAASASDMDIGLHFLKNGAEVFDGNIHHHVRGPANATDTPGTEMQTPAIEVSEGDRFEAEVYQDSGGARDLLADSGSGTWFHIQVVETANPLAGFPTLSVEVPFRGARVDLTADEVIADVTSVAVPWDAAQIDTGFRGNAFWAGGSPTRLTVPAGVTKVRLKACFRFSSVTSAISRVIAWFEKAGSPTFEGSAFADFMPGSTIGDNTGAEITSGYLDVTGGDYFELNVWQKSGNSQNLLEDNGSRTWFELEVIETDDAEFPAHDIGFFVGGTMGAGVLIGKHVAARRFELDDDFAGSVAHAGTVSTAARSFSVLRNGVGIGNINFALGASVATFVTSGGSPEQFEVGDRLTVTAPNPADANLADVAITLMGKKN